MKQRIYIIFNKMNHTSLSITFVKIFIKNELKRDARLEKRACGTLVGG